VNGLMVGKIYKLMVLKKIDVQIKMEFWKFGVASRI
jgi:hypothetical protein